MLSINHSEIKIQCINVNGGRLNYIFIIIKFCKEMTIINNAKDSENKKMFRQVILICRPLLTKGKTNIGPYFTIVHFIYQICVEYKYGSKSFTTILEQTKG